MKTFKVYIAGPLFSESEKDYNDCLNIFIEKMGFSTFLPQKDGYRLSDLLSSGLSKKEARIKIFEKDIHEIQDSDYLILNMDGRVPDEGACVELGYAYSLGKECLGIKTDCRSLISGADNPLIVGALKNRIARNFNELGYLLKGCSEVKNE